MESVYYHRSWRNKTDVENVTCIVHNLRPKHDDRSNQHFICQTRNHFRPKDHWKFQHPTSESRRLRHALNAHLYSHIRSSLCQANSKIHWKSKRRYSASTNGHWSRLPHRHHDRRIWHWEVFTELSSLNKNQI